MPVQLNRSRDAPIEPVKVVVRMRGLNALELGTDKEGGKFSNSIIGSKSWKVKGENICVQTTNTGESLPKKVGRTYFKYDRVFDEDASTREVYEEGGRHLVHSFVDGISGSLIVFGQTSAGKTYTMQGKGSVMEGAALKEGIIHMAIQDLFSALAKRPNSAFLLGVSAIEVYNEEVRDLLSPSQGKKAESRYDSKMGMSVDTVEEFATDFDSMIDLIDTAEKNRVVKSTKMNDKSSRSHVVFKIKLEKKDIADPTTDPDNNEDLDVVQISTLNLVDLAGSDTISRSEKYHDDAQKEARNINKSLLALSRVMADLGRTTKGFINYRDSNLTRLMQRDLKRQCKVAVICCITPSGLYTEQTRKTLELGKFAKGVNTRPISMEVLDERSIIIKTLRELNAAESDPGIGDTELELIAEKWNRIESKVFVGAEIYSQGRDDSKVGKEMPSAISTMEPDTSAPNEQGQTSSTRDFGSFASTLPSIVETNEADIEDCELSVELSIAEQKILAIEEEWLAIKGGIDKPKSYSNDQHESAPNVVPAEIKISDDEASGYFELRSLSGEGTNDAHDVSTLMESQSEEVSRNNSIHTFEDEHICHQSDTADVSFEDIVKDCMDEAPGGSDNDITDVLSYSTDSLSRRKSEDSDGNTLEGNGGSHVSEDDDHNFNRFLLECSPESSLQSGDSTKADVGGNLDSLETTLEKLSTENESLKRQMKLCQEEKMKISDDIEVSRFENQRLSVKLSELLGDKNQLEKAMLEIGEHKSENNRLKSKCNELAEKNTLLQHERTEEMVLTASANENTNDTIEENKCLRKDIMVLSEKLDERTRQLTQLTSDIRKGNSNEKQERLQKELMLLTEKLKEQTEEVSRLRPNEELNTQLRKKNGDMERDISVLTLQLEERRKEISRLASEIGKKEIIIGNNERFRQEALRLAEALNERSDEVENLSGTLTELENQVAAQKAETNMLTGKLDVQGEEMYRLTLEAKRSKELTIEKEQLQQEVLRVVKALNEKSEEAKEGSSMVTRLQEQLADHDAEAETLTRQLDAQTKEISRLTSEVARIGDLSVENERVQREVVRLTETLKEQSDKATQNSGKVIELEKQLVTRSAETTVLNRKLDEQTEEITRLALEVTRNRELAVENTRLQQEALNVEEELAERSEKVTELSVKIIDIEKQLMEQKTEKMALTRELDGRMKEIANLTAEVTRSTDLLAEKERLQKEALNSEEILTEQLTEQSEKVTKLSVKVLELEKRLVEHKAEKTALTRELNVRIEEITRLKSEERERQLHQEALSAAEILSENKVTELEKQLFEYKAEKAVFTRKLGALNGEITRLSSERSRNEELMVENEQLKQEVWGAVQKLNVRSVEAAELLEKISGLELQLVKQKAETSTLTAKLEVWAEERQTSVKDTPDATLIFESERPQEESLTTTAEDLNERSEEARKHTGRSVEDDNESVAISAEIAVLTRKLDELTKEFSRLTSEETKSKEKFAENEQPRQETLTTRTEKLDVRPNEISPRFTKIVELQKQLEARSAERKELTRKENKQKKECSLQSYEESSIEGILASNERLQQELLSLTEKLAETSGQERQLLNEAAEQTKARVRRSTLLADPNDEVEINSGNINETWSISFTSKESYEPSIQDSMGKEIHSNDKGSIETTFEEENIRAFNEIGQYKLENYLPRAIDDISEEYDSETENKITILENTPVHISTGNYDKDIALQIQLENDLLRQWENLSYNFRNYRQEGKQN